MEQNKEFIKNTYIKYLFPNVLSVIGGMVNVLFDSILVGRSLGTQGMAAVNLCMPVYLLLCTIGSLLVSGTAITAAREIGSNNQEKAQKLYSTAIITSVASSLLVMAVGLLLLPKITMLLCSDVMLREMVEVYTGITLTGALPKVLLYVPFWYLRLDGKNTEVTVIMFLMTGLNIALDIFFLFGLKSDIGGAAWASVIATAAACLVGMLFLGRKQSSFHFQFKCVHLQELWNVLVTGSPSAANNLLSALRVLVINSLLLSAFGGAAVAVFAAVNNISEFSLCILNGVPQTASAMLGVYIGERDNASTRLLMRQQWRWGFLCIGAFSTIVILCSGMLHRVFGLDVSLTVPLFCLCVGLFPGLANSVMTAFYNVNGRIVLANVITLLRIFLLAVGVLWVMIVLEWNVWLFLPLCEFLTLFIWLAAAVGVRVRDKSLSSLLLLDETLDREGRVMGFSVQAVIEDICEASDKITQFCEDNEMDQRQTMSISLAIEEIMIVILNKNSKAKSGMTYDVRAFALTGKMGIRIRYGGKLFNPLEEMREEQNADLYMGIRMIADLAQNILYQQTFGVNTLIILV